MGIYNTFATFLPATASATFNSLYVLFLWVASYIYWKDFWQYLISGWQEEVFMLMIAMMTSFTSARLWMGIEHWKSVQHPFYWMKNNHFDEQSLMQINFKVPNWYFHLARCLMLFIEGKFYIYRQQNYLQFKNVHGIFKKVVLIEVPIQWQGFQ